MLRSMTGFGEAQGLVEGVEFALELRSVNNRYFKASIRLPESFSALETVLEDMLRKRLARGSITLTVRMKLPEESAAWHVNAAALASYIEQLKPLEIEANPTLRIDLGSLLQLPGVCTPPEEDLCERTAEGLKKLLAKAIDRLTKMREQEGQSLRTDLAGNCSSIRENLGTIEDRAPTVLKEYHDRLVRRVEELTLAAKIKLDEETLAREVAIFAERCDVAEEASRLEHHMEQFLQSMDSPEPSGRKLDFIAQEMLREANTIASKSADAEVARAVVDIKTAVDRIKEQVQNVE